MKIKYKHQEPEIMLTPRVFASFDYISKNTKTNLIWTCLVRKVGGLYIVEDLYFPPQNVNEYFKCEFDEDYFGNVLQSTFNHDYRICKFNMIGRFMMSKSTDFDDTSIKFFEKLIPPSLDECLMMQLNDKGEMNFAVNRKATILSDLNWYVDYSNLLDKGLFKDMLDKKIGSYKVPVAPIENKIIEMERVRADVSAKKTPKSAILIENISWKDIV